MSVFWKRRLILANNAATILPLTMRWYGLIFLLGYSFMGPLLAQDAIHLRGQINQQQNQEPIAFANIGIAGKSFGTISNERGIFELYIPASYFADTLSFSFVGFKTVRLPIALLSDTVLQIQLRAESVLLEEVLAIYDNANFSRKLVKEAVKRMSKNYPTQWHVMKGFYRGINLQDEQYVHLEEAAFSLQTRGYKSPLDQQLIRIDQMRNTEDGRVEEWKTALFNWLYGVNPIYKLLSYDPLVAKNNRNIFHEGGNYYYVLHPVLLEPGSFAKNTKGPSTYTTLKDPRNIDYFDYKTVAIVRVDGEEAYVVEFENPHRKGFYGTGKLVIARESKAILKYEYQSRTPSDFHKEKYGIDHIAAYEVIYKRIGEQYFLHMIRLKSLGDEKNPASGFRDKQVISQEKTLVITDYILNPEKSQRISKNEALHKDTPLEYLSMQVNPNFWKNYNILPDKRIESEILQSIANQSLKTQEFE
jgi:hypothetical protein